MNPKVVKTIIEIAIAVHYRDRHCCSSHRVEAGGTGEWRRKTNGMQIDCTSLSYLCIIK